jgi:hypothetical protein
LLFGQATGSIAGTVTDVTGSAVPNAKVTVDAPATGASRSSTTNESGEYIVPLLGVADYTVQVELPGFQTAKAEGIRLQVDEHRELDFKLTPASVQSTVEVNATAVALQTSDATLGQVITSQQVADLPLNGRDFRAACHPDAGSFHGNQSRTAFSMAAPAAKPPRAVPTRFRWADRAPTVPIGCWMVTITTN